MHVSRAREALHQGVHQKDTKGQTRKKGMQSSFIHKNQSTKTLKAHQEGMGEWAVV